MVTNDFVYYVDYSESDDNANVVMYDLEGTLISDNYFANSDMFSRMLKHDFISMSETCAYGFKCMLDVEILPLFKDWVDDGNVIKLRGGFSTQDSQYTNRLKSEKELLRYFMKNFVD
jgi:hypothetical protein